jgi:hypothetical protein
MAKADSIDITIARRDPLAAVAATFVVLRSRRGDAR